MIIMANPSSELTMQDCKTHNTHSMLLKSFGDKLLHNHHGYDQTQNLQDFLSRLEEERLKIDAFKRELPLCMQLLTNAVEASRQQLQACRATEGPRPVLEEFIPLKTSSSETPDKSQNMLMDKANWMTSAQLWSQNETKPLSIITTSSKENDIGFDVSPKLALHTKQRSGGAFLPFSKERNTTNTVIRSLPDLALASPDHHHHNNNNNNNDMEDQNKCFEFENVNSGNVHNINGGVGIEQGKASGNSSDGQTTNNNATNSSTTTNQSHRKARRCWSPDLHRRFVNALQMLGGSQVATPKQIRELMKVEGLTNDEVKSHLQKYRLHTRRPSPSPQATGGPTPQLVVLGGIWVPPEYATAAHGGGPTLYGAHHHHHHPSAPQTHFCAPQAVPQEFYAATVAQPQQIHHQHPLHHQLQMYKVTPPQNHSSPESDVRGAGDRSESIEDGKSESSSWKGDSGGENGNCGERRGLAALRENGEESNGSEITLKF